MTPYPTSRAVRVLQGVWVALEHHAGECGDRVQAIALHGDDHDELCLVEIGGIPVLVWEEVSPGRLELLCEGRGVLIPEVNTFEELQDRWAYDLQPEPATTS